MLMFSFLMMSISNVEKNDEVLFFLHISKKSFKIITKIKKDSNLLMIIYYIIEGIKLLNNILYMYVILCHHILKHINKEFSFFLQIFPSPKVFTNEIIQ